MYSRWNAWFRGKNGPGWFKRMSSSMHEKMQSASIFNRAKAHYMKLLNEKPLLTKSVTSGFLSFSANVFCQHWEIQINTSPKESDKDSASIDLQITNDTISFDWIRAIRFAFLGSALVGPVLHYWYGFLSRIIPGPLLVDAMKRLLLDQVIFAPAFIPVFFAANLLLEGKPEKIQEKIDRDFWDTVVTNYVVWIPAQFINFRLIPPNLQVLYSNTIGFFWNIYFSYAANRGATKDTSVQQVAPKAPLTVADSPLTSASLDTGISSTESEVEPPIIRDAAAREDDSSSLTKLEELVEEVEDAIIDLIPDTPNFDKFASNKNLDGVQGDEDAPDVASIVDSAPVLALSLVEQDSPADIVPGEGKAFIPTVPSTEVIVNADNCELGNAQLECKSFNASAEDSLVERLENTESQGDDKRKQESELSSQTPSQ